MLLKFKIANQLLLLGFNALIVFIVSVMLLLSRFCLKSWWWVVLAGSHSGLLLLPVTLEQTLRDREERVTLWLQRTEVLKETLVKLFNLGVFNVSR